MRTHSIFAAAALCAGLSAQTTLTVDPTAYDPAAVGLTYSNPGANFFDLNVLSPTGITLRAMEIPTQEPVGTVGEIQLWIQTQATSHVGLETPAVAPAQSNDPSGWQLLTSGQYTSGGFAVSSTTCQSAFSVNVPDTYLIPGSYGFAIVYVDVSHQFYGVTTYPAPAGTFFDGNVEISNGTTAANAWGPTLGAFVFNGNNYTGTMADFGFVYDVGPVPHACAETERIGEGSGTNVASWYDRIEDAPNVSAALQGRALQFTNIVTGYVVSEAQGATFRPASGNETVMPAVDDGEFQFTVPNLPVIFPSALGGGSTSDLWIHSNGYISFTGPNDPLFFVPIDPQAAMDQDEFTLFATYHDFNSTEAGSGQVWIEEDLAAPQGPTLYITWDGVESYPDTVVNPSTVQVQIDLITGNIVVLYENIDAVGGSTFAGGDDTLIGWSPAGVSPVVPEGDFATLGIPGAPGNFIGMLPEVRPLGLEVTGSPLLGGNIAFETSDVPSAPSIGTTILDTAVTPPVPLSPLGAAAGTFAYVPVTTSLLFSINNASLAVPLPIPNNPAITGLELYGQSFWFDLLQLGTNPFGNLLGSNAVRVKIGNF
ncbi:MAG: hypothetical protein VYA51_10700 [Planctomycetota bacterium]|nr:hypothetical protein [Planctomycetota bacterium]